MTLKSVIHVPTFLITVIMSFLLVFIFITLRMNLPLDCNFRKKSKEKFINSAKTGDILAVAYGSKRAGLVKVFTGSMWAHSAIIIKNENQSYVLEVARYSMNKRGIMVMPLDKWLSKNGNNKIAVSRYLGTPIANSYISHFLEKNEKIREEMNVANWLSAMVKRSYIPQNKKKMFCSELVCYFLQEIGIMRKKYRPSGYKPWELLYGNIPLSTGCTYDKPFLLIE